jgi:hypothetical protein
MKRKRVIAGAIGAAIVAAIVAVILTASGMGTTPTTPRSAAPKASPTTTVPAPQSNPIPQNDGGDHDADNNGGPSDGDGNT